MSVKLTDAQLVMLSGAAQRGDLCLTAPDKMKGAVLTKVGEKLMKHGLVREVRAKAGMPAWRRDDTGRSFALKLTPTGLKAIAIDDGSEDAVARGGDRMNKAGLLFAALTIAAPAPSFAWWDEGHMEIAAVAYDELTPAVRAKVDALIKLNPAYSSWIGSFPPEKAAP